ncbi:hypothetical protein JIN85_10865 [Luteolibacter pohnpeiensis]|uniref:Solute-binding protein family 5 domain-containing protein n=1 Tax=Luteolibacter pohnpeiensis TaxID=454153 RepID=A0A934VW50_9BACT|nr:ABC transporter substrate-binding protein [Luteolibacter pohnpeiensis]MBK1882920.1 hypothetical protein [Luteolibacter pohnpeiensis]
MRFLFSLLAVVAAIVGCFGLNGCRHEEGALGSRYDFDGFVPRYNDFIHKWLIEQQDAAIKEKAHLEEEIAKADDEKRKLLEVRLQANARELEKWAFRLSLGDYLKMGDPSEIPTDLVWDDGMNEPEIGDPRAKKGGVLRQYIPDFPPTTRLFGDNSNNSFRGYLYDDIDIPLVDYHRETMHMIPGVASSWAVSKDGRTIYYKIDPAARYSDGEPVHAKDYLVSVYVNVSDNVVNPYAKQYFKENLAQVAMYDDHTISISLPEAQVYGPLIAGDFTPSPPHFFAEYGPDYDTRYQWRFRPTTGAYEVKPEDIVKGVSITETRVKNWWAKDRKYYKYRYNPDKIVYTVVRDQSKAFELFKAGELDTFLITTPELWYEKSEMKPVYNGYIDKVTFYTRYPKIPRGLYVNVSRPLLKERDVRIGIAESLNWKKVINVMFRGDYQRLNAFNEGYEGLSDPTIKARGFSISDARASFAKAGFTQEDRDGILKKADGTRLSVSITYPTLPIYDQIFSLLREEAKNCGLELRLDGLEATVAYKKEMLKQHDIALGAWGIEPPMPDFYQFLHSSNAYDESGNLKPNTNNTFAWARPDTDMLSEEVRTATTMDDLRTAVQKLQHIMHDEAIFLPGYAVDFVRVGSWRWVRWPDSDTTKFCPPVVYDPHEVHVLWIDEDMKKETLEARREGKTFPESVKTVDDYRQKSPEGDDASEAPMDETPATPANDPTPPPTAPASEQPVPADPAVAPEEKGNGP